MAEDQDLVGECVCKEAMFLELRLLLCLAGAKESSSQRALLYLFFNLPEFIQVIGPLPLRFRDMKDWAIHL